MKKAFIIFTTLSGVVALVCRILYANRRNKSKEIQIDSNESDINKDTIAPPAVDLNNEKGKVSRIISDRHQEAAQIVKYSLLNFYEYNEGDSEHKKEFDEINNSLDMLLDKE